MRFDRSTVPTELFSTTLNEFGASIWIVTVADDDETCPSFTVYVNVSVPEKPVVGVKVNEPLALKVSVPWAGSVATVPVSGLPSGSELFAITPVVDVVVRTPFRATEYESFAARSAVSF